jgi:hypothetical protein
MSCLVIGDTALDKGEVGDRSLESHHFEANNGVMPVTAESLSRSKDLEGLTRRVIFIEGHGDGKSVTSVHIQKLILFCKRW